jgi:hypothetical protein
MKNIEGVMANDSTLQNNSPIYSKRQKEFLHDFNLESIQINSVFEIGYFVTLFAVLYFKMNIDMHLFV